MRRAQIVEQSARDGLALDGTQAEWGEALALAETTSLEPTSTKNET